MFAEANLTVYWLATAIDDDVATALLKLTAFFILPAGNVNTVSPSFSVPVTVTVYL